MAQALKIVSTDGTTPSAPWSKWLTNSIAIAGAVLVAMGLVWSAATITSGKADKSEVRNIRDSLHEIQTDIAVIKNILKTVHGAP